MSDETNAPEGPQEGTTPEGRAEEAFYTAPDGTSYATRDDLNSAYGSFVPKAVFTEKSQGLADERRTFQKEQQDWERQRDEQSKRFSRQALYEKMDTLYSQRPELARKWEQEYNDGASAGDVREQILGDLGPRLEKFEQYMAQQEAVANREAAYKALEAKYPDVDRDVIDKTLTELGKDGNMLNGLVEVIHFSGKGRKTPAEIAEEIVRNKAEKNAAGIPGGASRGTAKQKSSNQTINEIRQSQLEAIDSS